MTIALDAVGRARGSEGWRQIAGDLLDATAVWDSEFWPSHVASSAQTLPAVAGSALASAEGVATSAATLPAVAGEAITVPQPPPAEATSAQTLPAVVGAALAARELGAASTGNVGAISGSATAGATTGPRERARRSSASVDLRSATISVYTPGRLIAATRVSRSTVRTPTNRTKVPPE